VLSNELEGVDAQLPVLILRPINSASAVPIVGHKKAEIKKTRTALLILLIKHLPGF
jgi:hypothetical protein